VAVAFDVSRDTFRSQRYPDYKATRAKTPPEFKGQVELIKEILTALRIPVVTADGFEADDILCTLAHHCDFPVSIISGDRDTFQLIDQRVTVLYPRKGMSDLVLMTPDAVKEKYGVLPEQYRDLAAMVGEASDNLPGVPGVGPKTAAKWIVQYGSLEKIISAMDEISGKVGESLREHKDRVLENYDLNRLVTHAPVETDIKKYAKADYDPTEVHQVLDSIEFSALRTRIFNAWPTSNPGSSPVETKTSAAPAKKAPAKKAQPATADSAETLTADGDLSVVSKKESGAMVKKWLAAQKELVGVAFSGAWSAGRGSIDAVAFINSANESIWCEYLTNQEVVNPWLQSDSPKAIHDAKGPALALLSQGVKLNGIEIDTALAAYLLAPGSRNLTLSDLTMRYLKKNLAELENADAQLSFDTAGDVSGDKLALHAHATFELAKHFLEELKTRGGSDLLNTLEIPLLHVLVEMEASGIAIDTKALKGN
jgi:DNA polymerase-1